MLGCFGLLLTGVILGDSGWGSPPFKNFIYYGGAQHSKCIYLASNVLYCIAMKNEITGTWLLRPF